MFKQTVIVSILIILPLNLIANLLYAEPLYNLGVQLILKMQKFSSPPLDAFMIVFTFIIDPALIMASIILVLLLMKRKLTAYSTIIFVVLNTYLLTISKCFDAAPRPYWTHAKVRNIGYYCPKDYGAPSGHAQFAAIMFCTFLFEFFETKKNIRYPIFAAIMMIMVSVSRMYLGAHSLDQVVHGLFIGIALSLVYVQGGLREQIKKLIIFQKQTKYRIFLISIIVAMHLLSIVGFYANRRYIDSHKSQAKVWIKNFNSKCNKDIDEHHLNFMMLVLNTVLVNLFAGLVFGFGRILDRKELAFYLLGQWKINAKRFGSGWISKFVYHLVSIGFAASGFIIFGFIPLLFGNSDFYKLLYLNLSCLVSSYAFAGFTYPMQQRLNLIEISTHQEKSGKIE